MTRFAEQEANICRFRWEILFSLQLSVIILFVEIWSKLGLLTFVIFDFDSSLIQCQLIALLVSVDKFVKQTVILDEDQLLSIIIHTNPIQRLDYVK